MPGPNENLKPLMLELPLRAVREALVVLPTYNEKDSIRKVIQDFEELGFVDEILVINNNAIDGTSTEVRHTSAIEIHESVQGYGAAIQRGLREATGDLIAVCEPDDTFLARDLTKFLAYAEDVARGVADVRQVINNLRIQPPPTTYI